MSAPSVFDRLCDLTDELQRLCPDVKPEGVRYRLEDLVNRLDSLIDTVVGLEVPELADDDMPCPHCGEEGCEASCTGAILAREAREEDTPCG